MSHADDRTIRDFGEQWTRYRDNLGFYGSTEMFEDVFGPLMCADDLRGMHVCEIGAGTGRFVNVIAAAGAASIVAVEPSDAFDVLRENTRAVANRVRYLRVPGEHLPTDVAVDVILSIGVLHHVANPRAVLDAAFRALKPGGRVGIWVYGRENNGAFLAVATPLRAVTKSLPHLMLAGLVRALDVPLAAYIRLCRVMRLPLRRYTTHVLGRLSPDKRRLVIYDQLNPEIARYYRREDVEELLRESGFHEVRLYHRHGYSWAATATRPRE